MKAQHLEFFVEEPSMETFLGGILPRILPTECTFSLHTFAYKRHLGTRGTKLLHRLRAYAHWIPSNWRLVLLIDRDQDDCHTLKQQLDDLVATANLLPRSRAGGATWQVVSRIAIEELEAWYFGSWDAVRRAYPRVPATVPRRANFRDPDAVPGGTWEAFERILKRAGYYPTGLRKIEAARAVARHFDPWCNRSNSFTRFRDVVVEATR